MVEVHLIRLKVPATVGAGHPAKLAEELERCGLPDADALDLLSTMRGVVPNIEGTLVTIRGGHNTG